MGTHFFYVRNWNLAGSSIKAGLIPKETRAHFKSLRVKVGDRLKISDGCGKVFEYLVVAPTFDLDFVDHYVSEPLKPIIDLYLAPPRGDSLWETLSTCVQLGVRKVQYLESDNCELSKKHPRSDLWERSQRVADAAAEVCERAVALEFGQNRFLSINQVLQDLSRTQGRVIICDEGHGSKNFWGVLPNHPPMPATKILEKFSLFIGPEGGWSHKEREYMRSSEGVEILALGPCPLKVPVATASALTWVHLQK